MPVKTVTVINAAYNEYLRIRDILGPDRLPPLDLPAYFCTVYEAIWKIRGPCAAMRRHYQRWQEALVVQDEMVRERVRQGLKSHPMPRLAWFKCLLKRGRVAMGIDKLEQRVKGRKPVPWPFKTPLDYVKWADEEEEIPRRSA